MGWAGAVTTTLPLPLPLPLLLIKNRGRPGLFSAHGPYRGHQGPKSLRFRNRLIGTATKIRNQHFWIFWGVRHIFVSCPEFLSVPTPPPKPVNGECLQKLGSNPPQRCQSKKVAHRERGSNEPSWDLKYRFPSPADRAGDDKFSEMCQGVRHAPSWRVDTLRNPLRDRSGPYRTYLPNLNEANKRITDRGQHPKGKSHPRDVPTGSHGLLRLSVCIGAEQ